MDAVKAVCFHLPLWAVPIPAIVIGGLVYWGTNEFVGVFNSFTGNTSSTLPGIIGLIAFGLCLFAGFVGWSERRKRKELLAQTQSLAELRALSWRDFEKMVSEGFRKKGWKIIEGSGSAPDGGIDLDLTSPSGKRVIVQCKHWKKEKVGVSIVREMLGVLTREKADKVMIIATGTFTKEAIKWAEGQPIQLIDGPELLRRFGGPSEGISSEASEAQSSFQPKVEAPEETEESRRTCPKCGKTLVLRTAKKGLNAGNQFWGCSDFPKCRYTEPVGV